MAKTTKNRSIKIFFRFVMFFPIAFINIFAIVVALLAFFYARILTLKISLEMKTISVNIQVNTIKKSPN